MKIELFITDNVKYNHHPRTCLFVFPDDKGDCVSSQSTTMLVHKSLHKLYVTEFFGYFVRQYRKNFPKNFYRRMKFEIDEISG